MTAYYNEIDPYAAQWLRNLINAGHIAPGIVDERSIEDVYPSDLRGFTQCHFFAGIGVWSLALRSAGWADDRPVWTGSCPCQPFSAAGAGAGFDDERHLWPHFFHLISECHPPAIFGEQVASRDANPWIDLVQDDLEGVGYRVGAVPFPACGVGAPNKRDRLYWVADSSRQGEHGIIRNTNVPIISELRKGEERIKHDCGGTIGSYWGNAEWLECRDGKKHPVEPGTFPLAHGAPARVGRLRAYGNAINAEAARVFIEAAMSCMP